MRFGDKPVLVTGATGFIGRRLVNRLLKEHVSVRVFARNSCSFGTTEEENQSVDIVFGDISIADDVASAVRGCGTVIHVAAAVTDWGPRSLFESVTVRGTKNVLDSALKEDAKVVVVSSVCYYGDAIGKVVCHEEANPGRPVGAYELSKQRQEMVTREFMAKGGRAVIVRPTNVYGAGSRIWVDEVVKVLRKGLPVLIGQKAASNNAGMVHVDNVVDVLLRAAQDPRADGRAYNACDSDDRITWERYMTDLARISGASRPRYVPLWLAKCIAAIMEIVWTIFCIQSVRPPFTFAALNLVASNFQVPNTRAVKELGHKPQITYDEGIQEVTEVLSLL